MAQSVLNFAVESTDERLTPRAGEIVFGEYLKAIGMDKLCNTYLPQLRSNKGYEPFSFIQLSTAELNQAVFREFCFTKCNLKQHIFSSLFLSIFRFKFIQI